MKAVEIFTYNPKNQKSEFEFYALSKGLNSGKPLDSPCPNCFVISCRNAEELDVYRSLLLGRAPLHFSQRTISQHKKCKRVGLSVPIFCSATLHKRISTAIPHAKPITQNIKTFGDIFCP